MKRSKSVCPASLSRPSVSLLARTTEVIPESLLLETSFADLETCSSELSAKVLRNPKILYLVKLPARKMLLGYSECEPKVVELDEQQAEIFTREDIMQVRHAAGSERFRSINFTVGSSERFEWGSISSGLSTHLIFIIQSIKRVAVFADQVCEYYRNDKKHQAFSLLATTIYSGTYRSSYRSKIDPSRQGIMGIGLDMIQIGLEAHLEFNLLSYPINLIYELVPIADFTRDTLSPEVFGLSGSAHWLYKDIFTFDGEKMLFYLRSVRADDITEKNVAVFAILAWNLLFVNDELLDTAPVFSIFSQDQYNDLCLKCLKNADFRKSFNRKISDSEADLQEFGLDYPEVVFFIIKRAYDHDQIDLSCRAGILLQILEKEQRCLDFKDYVERIYNDIIAHQLAEVAKAFLSCPYESIKNFLSEDGSRRANLSAVRSMPHPPAPLLDGHSRLLVTPARGEVEEIAEREKERLLGVIMEFIRSKIIPVGRRGVRHFPPPRADEGIDITYLCKCVVQQLNGDEERSQLLALTRREGMMTIPGSKPTDEDIILFLQSYIARESDGLAAMDHPLQFACNKLMYLLQRPIIFIRKDDRDGQHGELVRYRDYVLTSVIGDDVRGVGDLVRRSSRPIIVLAEGLPRYEDSITALITKYKSKVCIVYQNGIAVLHQIEEYRKLCNRIVLRKTDESDCAEKKVELGQWIEDNRETHNVLLLHRKIGQEGWYIYAHTATGEFLRDVLVEANLGRLLRGRDISQAARLLEGDRVLLTEVTRFLGLSSDSFLPAEPLRVSTDPGSEVIDLRALWLKRFQYLLKDKLENNISITAASLMLDFDCFVDEVRMSSVKVRAHLECLGNREMRMAMVNAILDKVVASPIYGDLAIREAPAPAASTLVVRALI